MTEKLKSLDEEYIAEWLKEPKYDIYGTPIRKDGYELYPPGTGPKLSPESLKEILELAQKTLADPLQSGLDTGHLSDNELSALYELTGMEDQSFDPDDYKDNLYKGKK